MPTRHHTTSQRRTRLAMLAAMLAAALAMGLLAPGVATAAPPVETEPLVQTVPHACRPGALQTVTLTYLTTTHEHDEVTVISRRATLTTDDGFEGSGHQQDVIRDGILTSVLNLHSRNPATGEAIRVHGRIVVDLATGEFLEGSPIPAVRCLGS